jgi:hypothetical protein
MLEDFSGPSDDLKEGNQDSPSSSRPSSSRRRSEHNGAGSGSSGSGNHKANAGKSEALPLAQPPATDRVHPAAGPQAGAGADRGDPSSGFKVSSVRVGKHDDRDEKIDRIFFKRENYAIYGSKHKVYIHFSDKKEIADKQIDRVAKLFPLRDHLEYLASELKQAGCYQEQIANAFRLGIEGNIEVSKNLLNGAVRIATEERARRGRLNYLYASVFWSILISSCLISCLIFSSAVLVGVYHVGSIGFLKLSAAGGALGALLSIALAIRGRTVAPGPDWATNAVDGALRVMIGTISGGVLHLFLASGFINDVAVGGVMLVGTKLTWQPVLLIGFVAGFLERLVPDLLEKKEPFNATVAEKAGTTEPG